MLEAVVEKEYVHAFGFEPAALFVAVRASAKHYAILQAEFHEFDFVAGAGGAFVAAGEDGEAFPFSEKFFSEENHHGGFAGAADGEIAYADYRSVETFRF